MRSFAISVSLCALLIVAGCKGDPNTPAYWEKALSSQKKKDRIRVVEDMRAQKRTGPEFLAVLHKQLESEKQGEVKAAIARVLADAKSPSSVDAIISAIDPGASESDDRAANKELVVALEEIGDKKAVPTLVKLLNTKDNYTVIAAIEALGAMKDGTGFEKLNELATNDSTEPFIAKKAIEALGEIGDPRAVPGLVKMMFKERKSVSFYREASFALYQIGKPAADALIPVVEGKDKELAKWAQDANLLAPVLPAKSAQVLGDLHDDRATKKLIELLAFKTDALDIQLIVRMRAADALGRMRAKEAAKPLAAMVEEQEATARNEYIRALVRIGGKDAVPALTKAASKGSWDAREPAMVGLAMLGDEKDLPAFEKFKKDEEALLTAECKEDPEYSECKDVKASVAKHVEKIATHQKRIEAAKECGTTTACWLKKLDDADQGVRERAAIEIGRSNDASAMPELLKRLSEKNLEARSAIIQATDWLAFDNKDAAAKAKEALPAIEKQLAEEKGKTEFARVNEDLRRLPAMLKRI